MFARAVRRYAGLVYGRALRITRNPADAEDVSQAELLRGCAELEKRAIRLMVEAV